MGKIKKKNPIVYVWTEKGAKIFASKKIQAGDAAEFMGRSITDETLIASWARKGYVIPAEEWAATGQSEAGMINHAPTGGAADGKE